MRYAGCTVLLVFFSEQFWLSLCISTLSFFSMLHQFLYMFMFRYIGNKLLYIKPSLEQWQSGPRESIICAAEGQGVRKR